MNHRKYGKYCSQQYPDLYREITLNLPTTAKGNDKIRPSVHILADLNQF